MDCTQLSLFGSTKRCPKCGEVLPRTAFYSRESSRSGQVLSHCKACMFAEGKARREEHKKPKPPKPQLTEKTCTRCQQMKPIEAFPFRSDRPHCRRSHCVDCKRAEKRKYNEHNREARRKAQREYYQANRDECINRIRTWAAENPDKYRQIHSDWKKNNRNAVRASGHRYYARQKGNGGSWAPDDWERLKARYDWRCLMCGRQEVTDGIRLCFDHVVPLSLGGWNIISNAQPLCKSCNSKKHRRVLDLRKD